MAVGHKFLKLSFRLTVDEESLGRSNAARTISTLVVYLQLIVEKKTKTLLENMSHKLGIVHDF